VCDEKCLRDTSFDAMDHTGRAPARFIEVRSARGVALGADEASLRSEPRMPHAIRLRTSIRRQPEVAEAAA
jgi:hypothetical protein